MSGTPFMPLWVSDFLGDTLDLDAAEVGAYMLLLMAQWNRDGESLPNDAKKLQRVARCGRNWPKVWGNVERFFKTDEKGIYSKRLRLEAQNVAAKREVNKHNGSLGGKAKSLKTNNAGLADATETLERNRAIPEPEPYSKKEGTSVPLGGSAFSKQDFQDFWDAYPHRGGKKNRSGAEASFRRAIKAGVTVQQIASGVEAMNSDPNVQRGYARDPTTWLNQKGWTDEFTKIPNFSTITGGNNDRTGNNHKATQRTDPAIEQALRLAGVSKA
jgi:uncharacterized protein YdaU (DUF1376 family)